MKLSVSALLALSASSSVTAFTSTPSSTFVGTSSPQHFHRGVDVVGSAASRRHKVVMMAGVPIIDEWRINRKGELLGVVSNHPTLPNGDIITTSPLSDPKSSADNKIVTTQSGSKYKLGLSEATMKQMEKDRKAAEVAAKKAEQAAAKEAAALAKKQAAEEKAAAAAAATAAKKVVATKKAAPAPAPAKKTAPAPVPAPAAATPAEPSLKEQMRQAKIDFGLNGKEVGNGRYLLSGNMLRSTSGKSQIYNAYKTDSDGLPTGPRLTVKLSSNFDRLEQESRNYDKVTGGLFSGAFVKKVEYLPDSQGKGVAGAALVLESGNRNLKDVMSARQNQGLTGKGMRQAAVALAQCIQAMHTSNLVWTDLKAENFVVVTDSIGEGSFDGVKGIDLESVVPMGGPPLDYSPEACPPEFAEAYLAGRGLDFRVDYHYDIWSFGMLLFELSTGKTYFEGKSPAQITKILRAPSFEVDLRNVPDGRMRDLIKQCLVLNPDKRPGITQVLLHPYFLTTGLGPISL